jgi:teichuronic acid biosynthesis glycosyltransferase TuaC
VVFSTLFPHRGRPEAGLFVRERAFRVGQVLPITVVAPVPWFPFQALIRRWRPMFRPPAPREELQSGVRVLYPRFFSVPGVFKSLDGFFMALGARRAVRGLRAAGANVIDAHFGFPDGDAATRLARSLGMRVTITLRGTEVPHAQDPARRRHLTRALSRADRIFAVADSLKQLAVSLGIPPGKIRVVGNGVDVERFSPVSREAAREALGIARDALVLISVGGLTERKGFHRVIDCLPDLVHRFPGLQYLIVGAAGPEGDWGERLRRQVMELGLEGTVRFLGFVPPECLRGPLSAADVFVLATRNEGWANVFLEAMACGLPVVTTDVGGNREVVCKDSLGSVIPFGDKPALCEAISGGLARRWDREDIMRYARENSWDQRVGVLVDEFRDLARRRLDGLPSREPTHG